MIEGLVTPTKLLCHPSTLSFLTRNPTAARTLGPKGLMPSVRRGTVSSDIGQMIQDARGALDWATETTPADEHLVRAVVGRVGMERAKVEENVRSLVELVGDSAIGKDPAKDQPGASGARRGALKRAGIKDVFFTSADGYRISIA